MRILLDEMMPRPLKRELRGHDVSTVQEMGWSGVVNGELVQLAVAAGFEVLLTADRNLPYQQDGGALGLAAVVMATGGITLEELLPSIPAVLSVFARQPRPGTVSIIQKEQSR